MSTNPGITQMPVPSISLTASFGRAPGLMGTFGNPTLRTSRMRFPSMTMSTGPIGGAPVPSTSVTPRMMSRVHGPSPSLRSGANAGGAASAAVVRATMSSAYFIRAIEPQRSSWKRNVECSMLNGLWSAADCVSFNIQHSTFNIEHSTFNIAFRCAAAEPSPPRGSRPSPESIAPVPVLEGCFRADSRD